MGGVHGLSQALQRNFAGLGAGAFFRGACTALLKNIQSGVTPYPQGPRPRQHNRVDNYLPTWKYVVSEAVVYVGHGTK